MNEFELVDCGEYGLSIREKLKPGEYRMTDSPEKVSNRIKLRRLNPGEFILDTHTWDNDIIRANKAIGFTESTKVTLRPREHEYAVMFFDEDLGNYWFHVPEHMFEKLFEEDLHDN